MTIKLHEGFDKIEVSRGIINLTIGMLEKSESSYRESGELREASKCLLLVNALRVALERHDVNVK
jgi:hypothetical protein